MVHPRACCGVRREGAQELGGQPPLVLRRDVGLDLLCGDVHREAGGVGIGLAMNAAGASNSGPAYAQVVAAMERAKAEARALFTERQKRRGPAPSQIDASSPQRRGQQQGDGRNTYGSSP